MLKTLIKLRFRQMISGLTSKGKNRSQKGLGEAGMIILLFFSAISFLFIFAGMAVGMAIGFTAIGYNWFYFGMMAIMMFMLCFIGTVFLTKQQMFEAKDNQTLLAMPIRPRDILLSRVIFIGLTNYALAFMIGIPFGIVYAIVAGFNVLGAIFFVLGLVLIPLFALAISMLFGWILAVISGRMKHKNAVNLILSSVFMLIYFYLCFSWQSRLEVLIENGAEAATTISKYLPPIYHFGKAAADGSLMSFIVFAAICIIPFAIGVVLVSKNFVKIITTERGAAKIEYKAEAMKASSAFKAFSAMELKRLTSSPSYMLNAGMGLLFIFVAAFFFVLKRGEMMEALNLNGFSALSEYIGPAVTIAFVFMCSMNIISAGTISLEAKTLWQPRSLPVDTKIVLLAKLYPHIVISVPVIILATIIVQFALDISIVSRVMLVILPIVATVLYALLGLIINLNLPKFDWINEAQAIKQGMSPFLAMIVGMGVALISMLLIIMNGVFSIMPMEAALVVLLIIYVFVIFLLYRWVTKRGVEKFERLQSN
ncbi:MAG: hypothetical protein J5928_02985 [Firmicutes bacterium]|nr:hypothetical protein [Bacillota bacterium]